MKHVQLIVVVLFLATSCINTTDPLDVIKPYHANDPYFKATMVSLHFMIETDAIVQIDSIFNKLIQQYNLPINAKGAATGIFIGKSPYDAYDYQHVVVLTIQDEQIIKVEYDEIHKNGIGKQYNTEYNEHMKQSGTTPYLAYPQYEKQLLDQQNILNVDAISGATYSLYRFRYAVTMALIQAQLANK